MAGSPSLPLCAEDILRSSVPSPTTPAASWNRLSQPVNLYAFLPTSTHLLPFLSSFFSMSKEWIIFVCICEISPRILEPFIKMREKRLFPLVPFFYIFVRFGPSVGEIRWECIFSYLSSKDSLINRLIGSSNVITGFEHLVHLSHFSHKGPEAQGRGNKSSNVIQRVSGSAEDCWARALP